MNPKNIAFTHGGAPAPAPLSSSTMGDITGRRGHYGRAPERQHREGRKVGRPRLVLPAGPLSALMQVFQLKDKLRFEKKTEKTQRGQKRKETLYVVEHEAQRCTRKERKPTDKIHTPSLVHFPTPCKALSDTIKFCYQLMGIH